MGCVSWISRMQPGIWGRWLNRGSRPVITCPTARLPVLLHQLKHHGPSRVLAHLERLEQRWHLPARSRGPAVLAQATPTTTVCTIPGSRLAHWFWNGRKCQQSGDASTTQGGGHALGAEQRQSHAGLKPRPAQWALGGNLADASLTDEMMIGEPNACFVVSGDVPACCMLSKNRSCVCACSCLDRLLHPNHLAPRDVPRDKGVGDGRLFLPKLFICAMQKFE